MIDVVRIKDAARGRWRDLLAELGGIPWAALDGKGHPCPKCNGTDRFSFANWNDAGGVIFRKCFSQKNGDGISALRWLRDWDFPTTIARLAERLNIEPAWQPTGTRHTSQAEELTSRQAASVWANALERARNDSDETLLADREVYDWLIIRRLIESWEYAAFGIIDDGDALPPPIASWSRRSYRLVCPLYSVHDGKLSTIQARATDPSRRPSKMFPKGTRSKGSVFASAEGRAILAGKSDARRVILGEGLTDYLGLVIVAPVPVLSAAGVGVAQHSIGPWARGRDVWIALDADEEGRRAVMNVARRVAEHGGRPFRLNWPIGHDACDALEGLGAEVLASRLEEVILGGSAS